MICAICLDDFRVEPSRMQPYVLPCEHIFHLQCLEGASKNCGHFCPYCKRSYANLTSSSKLNLAYAAKIEKNEIKQFQILVKHLEGNSTFMFVNSEYTEKKLHALIAAETGINQEELRLCSGSKNLLTHGNRTLGDLGIENGSTVHVLLRLRGGI